MIDKTLTIQPSPTADVNGTPASYGPRAPFGITGVVVSFPNGISSDPPETLQIIESQTQVDGACENLIVATASDADGMSSPARRCLCRRSVSRFNPTSPTHPPSSRFVSWATSRR